MWYVRMLARKGALRTWYRCLHSNFQEELCETINLSLFVTVFSLRARLIKRKHCHTEQVNRGLFAYFLFLYVGCLLVYLIRGSLSLTLTCNKLMALVSAATHPDRLDTCLLPQFVSVSVSPYQQYLPYLYQNPSSLICLTWSSLLSSPR